MCRELLADLSDVLYVSGTGQKIDRQALFPGTADFGRSWCPGMTDIQISYW